MAEKQPQVGIGVFVFKEGKILLGKRKSSHGTGEYAALGGHLEFGESFEECARRETREEAGIEIANFKFLCVCNIKGYKDKHYVDIGCTADWESGEVKVMEPEKLESWDWYSLDSLPEPLFEPDRYYLEALNSNKNFFDF